MTPARESVPATIESFLEGNGLVFREVRYASDCGMPSHAHAEAHLFFCLAGTIQHERYKESRFLTPSTLAFLPDGEPHANRFHDNVRTFDIVLKAHWMERLRQFSTPINRPVEFDAGPSNGLAMRLYREFRHRDDLTPLMMEGLTLELLAQMSRHPVARIEQTVPRWLVHTIAFLRAHFTENLSLERIAAAAGVHPDHLTRAFRQHYRISVGDYVRRLRVEAACQLLTTSDASLSQIALETGFADQSHFHKNFKALMGMTPTQFRTTAGADADFRQTTLP